MDTVVPTKGKVVGIIMTYNCAKFIEEVYRRLPKENFDQIICMDDESRDDSVAVAQKLGIPTFTHPHTGYGGNLLFGLRKAVELGGTQMIEIHGDGQYDIALSAPLAIDKLNSGFDFILGNRFYNISQAFKDGMGPIPFCGNVFLSVLARVGTRIPLQDFFPGFRAYSKRFVETLDFSRISNDYFFSFQIIIQAQYHRLRIGHVPTRCDYKREHTSISISKGIWAIFQTSHAIFLYWLALCGIRRGIFS
ncbi:MAG: glycosyltransferase family 2 protein [bacterium]|nr:glycosyltransferase family 2 protein [bacterium]